MYLGVNGKAFAGKGFLRTTEGEEGENSPSATGIWGRKEVNGGMVMFASARLPRLCRDVSGAAGRRLLDIMRDSGAG